MGRKNKFSKEVKLQAINDYKNGIKSISQIANDLICNRRLIYKWVVIYDSQGESAFEDKPKNKTYTKEFKLLVVTDYLSGKGSLCDLMKKYKLTSHSIVSGWIKEYNNSGELKDYNPKHEVYTMKARKTTYEERVEIVNYCISHDNDYKGTAEKYTIPYSLVYQWVLKYNKLGNDGLQYVKKGPKPKTEIIPTTPEEKLRVENEKLKRELERVKFENEVLKKKKYFENLIH